MGKDWAGIWEDEKRELGNDKECGGDGTRERDEEAGYNMILCEMLESVKNRLRGQLGARRKLSTC